MSRPEAERDQILKYLESIEAEEKIKPSSRAKRCWRAHRVIYLEIDCWPMGPSELWEVTASILRDWGAGRWWKIRPPVKLLDRWIQQAEKQVSDAEHEEEARKYPDAAERWDRALVAEHA